MSGKKLLEIDGVSKNYGALRVLDRVSLQVGNGEIFFLLGPSGCGKTTLLRIIGGLIPSDEGTVSLNGKVINEVPAYRRDINTVFQNYALFPHLSVFDNVAFGLRMKKVPEADIRQKVEKSLAMVELGGYGSRTPAKLSGGQQQRVALARALVNEPSLLLLDEPLGALDVKLRRQMQLELKHLQRDLGTTFICVTHDQEEAMTMADRIALMNNGVIVQIGTPEDIYNHPRTRFVADFMGESNFFTGLRHSVNGDVIRIETGDANPVLAPIPVRNPANPTDTSAAVGTSRQKNGANLLAGVRPEKISISLQLVRGSDRLNSLPGVVDEIVFVGSMRYFIIRTGTGHLFRVIAQTISGGVAAAEGDTVYMTWPVGDTFVVEDDPAADSGDGDIATPGMSYHRSSGDATGGSPGAIGGRHNG